MSIYGDSIFLNEGLFKKNNKKEESKINYIERTENFISSPKTIPYAPNKGYITGILYGVIFGLLITKYNYNDSKFLSLIKNNINNFTSISLDRFGYFSEDYLTIGQSDYIFEKFGKINSLYIIAYGADENIYYCKEKNKIFHTDYKHVYFDFSLNSYKDWPNEYIGEK